MCLGPLLVLLGGGWERGALAICLFGLDFHGNLLKSRRSEIDTPKHICLWGIDGPVRFPWSLSVLQGRARSFQARGTPDGDTHGFVWPRALPQEPSCAAGAAQDEPCWTAWAVFGVCRALLFATRAAALGFGSCSLLFCAS